VGVAARTVRRRGTSRSSLFSRRWRSLRRAMWKDLTAAPDIPARGGGSESPRHPHPTRISTHFSRVWEELAGFSQSDSASTAHTCIQVLDLEGNAIAEAESVEWLRMLPSLQELIISAPFSPHHDILPSRYPPLYSGARPRGQRHRRGRVCPVAPNVAFFARAHRLRPFLPAP
jgi:hypothetical protein